MLMEVPKEKKDILETVIVRDTCGYGIYPWLYRLEQAGSGTRALSSLARYRYSSFCRAFSSRVWLPRYFKTKKELTGFPAICIIAIFSARLPPPPAYQRKEVSFKMGD